MAGARGLARLIAIWRQRHVRTQHTNGCRCDCHLMVGLMGLMGMMGLMRMMGMMEMMGKMGMMG